MAAKSFLETPAAALIPPEMQGAETSSNVRSALNLQQSHQTRQHSHLYPAYLNLLERYLDAMIDAKF